MLEKDIYNSLLKNHSLHGEHKGYISINAGGDLRIIFKEYDGYIKVLFLKVGTHSQLY